MTGTLNMGTNNIESTGTISANTFQGAFSGSGANLTNLPLPISSTTVAGIVRLDSNLTVNSTILAATASTVFTLNNNINNFNSKAVQKLGDTMTGTLNMGTNNIESTGTISANTFQGAFSGSGANLISIPSTAINTNPTFKGTTSMSNVIITGSLTACNINNILETVTIRSSEIVQSNLNVYDSIVFGSNITPSSLANQIETFKVFGQTGLYTTTGNTVLYTNSIGQIGIGTTLPAFTIDLGTSVGQTVRANLFSGSGASLTDIPASAVKGTLSQWNTTTSADAIYLLNSNVGIGTSTPQYPMHVSSSNSGVSIYANYDITAYSDARVKTHLQRIPDALSKVNALSGYTYNRLDGGDRRFAGLIAQEVIMQLPEVVHTNIDGMLSVSYGNMISLLIEAIKELDKKIDTFLTTR
jgi:hypothetical protein